MKTAALLALAGALVACGLSLTHVLAPTNMVPHLLFTVAMILALGDVIASSDRKF